MSQIKRSDERNTDHYVKFLQEAERATKPNVRTASRNSNGYNVCGEFAVTDGMPAIYNNGITLRLSQLQDSDPSGDPSLDMDSDSGEKCPSCGMELIPDGMGGFSCSGCGEHFTTDELSGMGGQGANGSPIVQIDLTKYQTPTQPALASAHSKFKRVASMDDAEFMPHGTKGYQLEAPRPIGLEHDLDDDPSIMSCPQCHHPWRENGKDFIISPDGLHCICGFSKEIPKSDWESYEDNKIDESKRDLDLTNQFNQYHKNDRDEMNNRFSLSNINSKKFKRVAK